MEKKYELTEESIQVFGKTLYRIRALRDFGDVKAGNIGGYIEKEDNLSQLGNAWVYGNARVYGDARVSDKYSILWISNIGSRADTTTFFRTKDKNIFVKCGCFTGDIDEFEKKVMKTHRDNRFAQEYCLAIALAKLRIGGNQNV